MSGPPTVAELAAALAPHGLRPRGALAFRGSGPVLADGSTAGCVVLVGHAGGEHWPAFSQWLSGQVPKPDHPLDAWSKQVVAPVAARFDAVAFYPSDPPYQPFQSWAMAAEGLRPSPLGLLIHPDFGLWHGYRAALAFREALALPEVVHQPHPCDVCVDKPCLSHCPAGAVSADLFDVSACRSHLARREPDNCLMKGCMARDACPIGRSYRYPEDEIRFHMAALKLPA